MDEFIEIKECCFDIIFFIIFMVFIVSLFLFVGLSLFEWILEGEKPLLRVIISNAKYILKLKVF